jgi:hypothetical protein
MIDSIPGISHKYKKVRFNQEAGFFYVRIRNVWENI